MRKNTGGVLPSPGQHYIKRFCRIFPWVFSTQLVLAVWQLTVGGKGTSLGAAARFFMDCLPDILQVRTIGVVINNVTLNGYAWTVQCMIFVEFLMWGCLKFFRKPFTEFIVPASIFIGLALWASSEDTSYMAWLGLVNFSTLRTWIAYCVGYECLLLSRKLAALRLKRYEEYLLTIFECLGHAVVLTGMVLNWNGAHYRWFLSYIAFGALTVIALSGHSLVGRCLQSRAWTRKLSGFLGELSLPLYLVQGFVIPILAYVYPDMQDRYESKPVFLAFLIGSAVLQWLIVPRLVRLFRSGKERWLSARA